MKVEIVAKETIKPSSPAPRTFNLCMLDQVSPPVYTKLYFFYRNSSTDNIPDVIATRSQCLKSSLSDVLTLFYPFTGKIRDQMSVSFEEDDGAEFVEAKVDATLSDYLETLTPGRFKHLVPEDFWEVGTRPLLMIQANFFTCGGLAIGMNFSHKVSDAATFTYFTSSWADAAIGKLDGIKIPDFSGSQVFPALEELFLAADEVCQVVKLNYKTNRFVFTASQIAALQKKSTNESVTRPSRIETITTFIWRIGMRMAMKIAGGNTRSSVLLTPINLRRRLSTPICDQSFGNLVETQIVPTDGTNIEMSYLISLFREKIKESNEAYARGLEGEEFMKRFMAIGIKMMELIPQPEVQNAFTISSWSKFPLYEADFGWGKPIWVATHNPTPYITMLMDTPDGTGFEAWINLPEEEMTVFANDEELLTYGVPDPSILN